MAKKKITGSFTETYVVSSAMKHVFSPNSIFDLVDDYAIDIESNFSNVIVNSNINVTPQYLGTSSGGGVFLDGDFCKLVLGAKFRVDYTTSTGESPNGLFNDVLVWSSHSEITNRSTELETIVIQSQYNKFFNFGNVANVHALGANKILNEVGGFINEVRIGVWNEEQTGRFINHGVVGRPWREDGVIASQGDGRVVIQNFGSINVDVYLSDGDDRFVNGPGARAPDVIFGGGGDDRYVFIGATKHVNEFRIVEGVGQGIDGISFDGAALRSYFNNRYQMPNNVENLIVSSKSNALLSGNSINNSIVSGSGNDSLFGNNGHDKLVGGYGIDTLSGGNGKDTFVFLAGHTGRTFKTADRIVDLEDGDRIDLSGWDANVKANGMQDWKFSGNGALSGRAGELVIGFAQGVTYLMGDSNGDRKADLFIRFGRDADLPTIDSFVF